MAANWAATEQGLAVIRMLDCLERDGFRFYARRAPTRYPLAVLRSPGPVGPAIREFLEDFEAEICELLWARSPQVLAVDEGCEIHDQEPGLVDGDWYCSGRELRRWDKDRPFVCSICACCGGAAWGKDLLCTFCAEPEPLDGLRMAES